MHTLVHGEATGADGTVLRALTRVDLLRELEEDAAATYELDRARRRYGTGRTAYAFAEALAARGYGSAAISIGWEIYRREGMWNERLLRILYPFPYRDIVLAEAEVHDVDPYLAAGLIRQLDAGSTYRSEIEKEIARRVQKLEPHVEPRVAGTGAKTPPAVAAACSSCATVNDADARFCKHCGQALGTSS